jgi:hypothetical protein
MTPVTPPANWPSWACLQALAPADTPPAPLTPAEFVARLKAVGTRSRVVEAESLEELAQATDGGGVAVLFVNAGLLWGDPAAVDGGEANHCVLAKGLTDAGATLHDPARPTAGVVAADTLVSAWLRVGGRMLAAG